ncbi:MAG: hypothetical protein J3K34DRAFT_472317 [Monoraphidium minutum]|nr:MAG: hypothetical protein J3K34DRAFT_472317 [Monoraphidium minutum]
MASAGGDPARAGVRATAADHVVLRSTDPVASVEWWARVVGAEPLRVDEYRAGKAPFPSARISPSFLIDFAGPEMAKLTGTGTGGGGGEGEDAPAESGGAGGEGAPLAAAPPAAGQLDHVCLCLADGADMAAAAAALSAAGAPPLAQFDGTVVSRFGARGVAQSVYVRTPEGATLELRSYPKPQQ